MQYYIERGGKKHGPFSLAQIQQLSQQGKLMPGDLACREGMSDGIPVAQVLGLLKVPSTQRGAVAAAVQAASGPAYSPAPAYAAAAAAPAASGYQPYAPPAARVADTGDTDFASAAYAGFWLRFVAFFLDNIIAAIIAFPVGFVMGALLAIAGSQERAIEAAGNLLGFLISWLYFALMESSAKQATFGKMALGLKVTDLDGQRIGFGRATGRHFAKLLSGITLCIGYIMAGFTERKQALHDMLAKTLVIKP